MSNYLTFLNNFLKENSLHKYFKHNVDQLNQKLENFTNKMLVPFIEILANKQTTKETKIEQITKLINSEENAEMIINKLDSALTNKKGGQTGGVKPISSVHNELPIYSPFIKNWVPIVSDEGKKALLYYVSELKKIDPKRDQELLESANYNIKKMFQIAEEKKNINSTKSVEQLRTQSAYIDDKIDLVKLLLLSLSTMPLAGWIYDVILFFYSLLYDDYLLSILTVFSLMLSIFGVGPLMKLFYLFNESQQIRSVIDNPEEISNAVFNKQAQKPLMSLQNGNDYLKQRQLYSPNRFVNLTNLQQQNFQQNNQQNNQQNITMNITKLQQEAQKVKEINPQKAQQLQKQIKQLQQQLLQQPQPSSLQQTPLQQTPLQQPSLQQTQQLQKKLEIQNKQLQQLQQQLQQQKIHQQQNQGKTKQLQQNQGQIEQLRQRKRQNQKLQNQIKQLQARQLQQRQNPSQQRQLQSQIRQLQTELEKNKQSQPINIIKQQNFTKIPSTSTPSQTTQDKSTTSSQTKPATTTTSSQTKPVITTLTPSQTNPDKSASTQTKPPIQKFPKLKLKPIDRKSDCRKKPFKWKRVVTQDFQ